MIRYRNHHSTARVRSSRISDSTSRAPSTGSASGRNHRSRCGDYWPWYVPFPSIHFPFPFFPVSLSPYLLVSMFDIISFDDPRDLNDLNDLQCLFHVSRDFLRRTVLADKMMGMVVWGAGCRLDYWNPNTPRTGSRTTDRC